MSLVPRFMDIPLWNEPRGWTGEDTCTDCTDLVGDAVEKVVNCHSSDSTMGSVKNAEG